MSKDYGFWSIADLKNELRKRKAKVAGKRLEDYDKLFGPIMTESETVFKITVPAPQHFRDVTSNSPIPILTEEDMNTFCQLTERENIETSNNMYKQFFFKSCRVAVTNSEYYITGIVASEMQLIQLIKPADKVTIHSDHDYLEKTIEQEFLDALNLTEEERLKVEEKTRTNKKLWKKEHLMRIHSSHYGTICTTKGSKKNIARSLVKNVELSTPPIKHGIKYEEEAIRHFENETNKTTVKCGIIVHKDYPFLASTPDRLVGESSVLEVKCPYTAKLQTISPETVPYLYLCEKTGQLKLNEEHIYYFQVQGQMMCSSRKRAYFCVYTLKDFKIIIIERNDRFIETMCSKLVDFYNVWCMGIRFTFEWRNFLTKTLWFVRMFICD